jgi:hypothetical protein
VPLKATHGWPSLPVVAVSWLLVNGTAVSGGMWVPETDHELPDRGRLARNVPCGLPEEFVWMPFHSTSSPDGVAVASGSLARNQPEATVTERRTAPPAVIGVSLMRYGPLPLSQRTCSTSSVPRTSPMSGMVAAPASGVVTRSQRPGRMAAAELADPAALADAAALADPAAAPSEAISRPQMLTARIEGQAVRARNMVPPRASHLT